MPKYLILINVPTIIEIESNSEENAIQLVKQQLINNNQIKENNPIEIQVIEEGKIVEDESTYSY